MVLTKRPDSYYGSRRPTVSNRTRFLATPQTVTSFLVGANARYHSRSPFLISAFQLFPCGFTEPTLGTAPGIGTVPPAHGLTRQISDRSTPLHEPFRRLHGRFAAFRRIGIYRDRRKGRALPETAGFQKPRCPAYRPDIGNSGHPQGLRAASFRPRHFAALCSAARKMSALTPNYRQWADTSSISLRAGHLTANPAPVAVQPPVAQTDGKCKHRGV